MLKNDEVRLRHILDAAREAVRLERLWGLTISHIMLMNNENSIM